MPGYPIDITVFVRTLSLKVMLISKTMCACLVVDFHCTEELNAFTSRQIVLFLTESTISKEPPSVKN
jgi:hypothetical protein